MTVFTPSWVILQSFNGVMLLSSEAILQSGRKKTQRGIRYVDSEERAKEGAADEWGLTAGVFLYAYGPMLIESAKPHGT